MVRGSRTGSRGSSCAREAGVCADQRWQARPRAVGWRLDQYRPDHIEIAGADYSILVTHQFDTKLAAPVAGNVDLVLAGHTHGGQVNPVIGVIHVARPRIETPFIDGGYALGSAAVIVPLRYASPGAVELIDISLCGPGAR